MRLFQKQHFKLNNMEKQIFKSDAKQIVDLFFETKLFKEHVTRDDMNGTEEFIQHLLESRYDSYVRLTGLLEKIEKSKTK